MEKMLLMGAVTFFLLCMLIFLRRALANSLGWGLAGLVFPPAILFFYAATWQKNRGLALVHFSSALFLLLSAMMWVRVYPYALEGTFFAPLSREWAPAFVSPPMLVPPPRFIGESSLLNYTAGRSDPAGKLHGQPVEFGRVTLLNGLLRFKPDNNRYPRVELTVDLADAPMTQGANRVDVMPESARSPALQILRYEQPGALPRVERFDYGFWLELVLTVEDSPVYAGYIKLRLPDRRQSFVAGSFRAYTQDVRFVDGSEIDRSFDSSATLEYVAEQYLINRLGNALLRVNSFSGTFYQTRLESPAGYTDASLLMGNGALVPIRLELSKGPEGWAVDKGLTPEMVETLRNMRI